MRGLRSALGFAAAAAGGGWAAWTVACSPADRPAAIAAAAALALAFGAFYAADRRGDWLWFRFGVHGGALAVSAATVWARIARPLAEDGPGALLGSLPGMGPAGLAAVMLTVPGLAIASVLWLEAALQALQRLLRRARRQRADSDLYGRASFLGRRYMRRLARRRGILLGQWGRGPRAPLIGWRLEGSAMTIAPPRTGKGATIALNMLSPGGRGFAGSTVLIDPRGEIWCVAARRRLEMDRRVLLLDPFGVAARHARQFPEAHFPAAESACFNPLDFIRDDEAHAYHDICILLDALLTPPKPDAHPAARHFYESAHAIIAGYMAWVRYREPGPKRTLETLYRLLSLPVEEQAAFAERVRATERFAGGLAHLAIERQLQTGSEEKGSNFSTIANQLAFLNFAELRAHTRHSTFDPLDIADGDTDLFVVAPEEMIDHVRAWIRLWIAIPNAVPGRRALERDLLLIIDEMPRLGFLKPVMDGYNLAAGKGVHFWCFAQSLSALDSTWGRTHRKTLTDLAEVMQILGFPRTDAAGAEEMSKALGTATFESRTESRSGTVSENRIVAAGARWQAGESRAMVRERLVTPDELMTLPPDLQYVIAAPKDMPRDPLRLHQTRYWDHRKTRGLADPNPFVLRKERAAEEPGKARGRRSP